MSSPFKERRKFPRIVLPCLTRIKDEGGVEEHILTHTENISLGGICVIIPRSLALFSALNVELDLMDGGSTPVVCRGRVVWSKCLANKNASAQAGYETGIELDGIAADLLLRLEAVILRAMKNRD